MPNSQTPQSTTRKPRKPSQTARILENVELLVALYEEQGSASTNSTIDASFVEESLQASVEKLLDTRLCKLEERLLCNLSAGPQFEPSKFEAQIKKSLAKVVEEKTTAIEKRFATQIDLLVADKRSSSESVDAMIELVSDQMSQQTEALAEKIESVSAHHSDSNTGPGGQTNEEIKAILSDFQTVIVSFKEKFQSLEETIELQASTFESTTQEIQANVEDLVRKLETSSPAVSELPQPNKTLDSPVVEDESSHWQKQKEAMLAKYGIDPEYRPLDEPTAEPIQETEKVAALETAAAEKLEVLHQTIDSISPEDKDAIEKLKRDLNAKLRDAEVELSINRARLSQERAELEQQQSDLEHRTAHLEAKLKAKQDDSEDESKKGGLMRRFTRHLGK